MGLTQVSTDGVKNDAITKVKIPANQIEASELADNAVDETAIANGAVTINKLATNAVDNSKIGPQAVTLSRIINGTSSEDGKFLRANNGASPSFETVTSTTINNNADNRVITGSGTANTLEAESNLSFTSNTLKLDNASSEIEVGAVAADNYTSIKHEIAANSGDPMRGFVAQNNNASLLQNLQGGTNQFLVLGDTDKDQSDKCLLGVSTNVGSTYYKRLELSGLGNLTIAKGIKFNNDTAAANELDDYEEGTYTPTPNSGTATSNDGQYTKIGNFCIVTASITPSGNGTGGAMVQISLPFTAAGGRSGSGFIRYSNSSISNTITMHVNGSNASMDWYQFGGSPLTYSEASNNRYDFCITYRTA